MNYAHWCPPKGHPLTEHLKDMFAKTYEAGLHVRWNLEWSFLGNKVDYHKTKYVVSSIDLENVEMAIYGLVFGLSSAIIVFVAEILTKMFWKR